MEKKHDYCNFKISYISIVIKQYKDNKTSYISIVIKQYKENRALFWRQIMFKIVFAYQTFVESFIQIDQIQKILEGWSLPPSPSPSLPKTEYNPLRIPNKIGLT